jgi:Zn-dependent protease
MKQSIKLFNFQGTPVYLSLWFLLLFLIFPMTTTIGIFVSVLLHEMGHAWMANRKGYNVYSITIDMLSGAAAIDSNMHDRDSISITASGPITTLLLSIISFIGYTIYPIGFLYELSIINVFLFIFNILPIYPMDGGQIVRSYANLSRNRYQNRRLASWISVVFSALMVIYAISTLSIVLILFGCYFAYISLKELGYFNN